MKYKNLIVIAAFAVIQGCAAHAEKLPYNAIQKGSLSNQKLINDTKVGVLQKMTVLGCSKPELVDPYVISEPKGSVGSRVWREIWVVKGCNK